MAIPNIILLLLLAVILIIEEWRVNEAWHAGYHYGVDAARQVGDEAEEWRERWEL